MYKCLQCSEDVVRQICDKTVEVERERRGIPPFDWLPTGKLWEMREIETIISNVLG